MSQQPEDTPRENKGKAKAGNSSEEHYGSHEGLETSFETNLRERLTAYVNLQDLDLSIAPRAEDEDDELEALESEAVYVVQEHESDQWQSLQEHPKHPKRLVYEHQSEDNRNMKKAREASPLAPGRPNIGNTIPIRSEDAERIAHGVGFDTVNDLVDKGNVFMTVDAATADVVQRVLGELEHENQDIAALDKELCAAYKSLVMDDKNRLVFVQALRAFKSLWLEGAKERFDEGCANWNILYTKIKKDRWTDNGPRWFTQREEELQTIRDQLRLPNLSGDYVRASATLPDIKELMKARERESYRTLHFKWFSYQDMGCVLRAGEPIDPSSIPMPVDLLFDEKIRVLNHVTESWYRKYGPDLIQQTKAIYERSGESERLKNILSMVQNPGDYLITFNGPLMDYDITEEIYDSYKKILRKLSTGVLAHCAMDQIHTWLKEVPSNAKRNRKPSTFVQVPNHIRFTSELPTTRFTTRDDRYRGLVFRYNPKAKSPREVELVHDLQAIREISSQSVLFCWGQRHFYEEVGKKGQRKDFPRMPIRQILADYIPGEMGKESPPIIICKTIEMNDRKYNDKVRDENGTIVYDTDNKVVYDTDPSSPRWQLLVHPDGRYHAEPWTYSGKVPDDKRGVGPSVFGDLTVYIRKDIWKGEVTSHSASAS